MGFLEFELERWQSDYEHAVEFNLADSSVRGAPLRDVLPPDELERFLSLELGYPMVNGTGRLREAIAALYRDASPEQVLVTVGGAEANQIACHTLIGSGDRVAVMEPGYRQVWGIAQGLGARLLPFALDSDQGWRPRLDALEAAAREGLNLIYLVNPNNPTGSVLRPDERRRIIAVAEKTGAWILADEVYRGAERFTDVETESFWGDYPKVVAVNSLSKAYGLAGLRIGWLVAPSELISPLWRRHEYATISAAGPSMRLAELALGSELRSRLIARQRTLTRSGWDLLDRWTREHADLVSVGAAEATSMAFVKYRPALDSVAVADRIRREASVLVAPGEFLGADRHLRITHGLGAEYVEPALGRIAAVLRGI